MPPYQGACPWLRDCKQRSRCTGSCTHLRPVPARLPTCLIPDDVWVMHWKVGRVNCTFKVRVRRGWADLRAFLAEVSCWCALSGVYPVRACRRLVALRAAMVRCHAWPLIARSLVRCA